MTRVFLDTSFLLALVISDDALHGRAVAWQRADAGPFLTTEYVLIEFVDARCAEPLRETAVQAVARLRADAGIEIIPSSTAWLERGLTLFSQRPDKRWSLTDCISFAVMADRKVTRAFTADHHFEQAGFDALLRHAP